MAAPARIWRARTARACWSLPAGTSPHGGDFAGRHGARRPQRPAPGAALDYRGRGLSDHDPDPDNYTIPVELDDVLSVLTARAVESAVFVGTSRGGLILMTLAALRPGVIAGAVLNDIGPVLETQGLMRIKDYVGKLPVPRDFADGGEILRRLFGAQFPRLTAADWLASAQRMWRQSGGHLVITYDTWFARARRRSTRRTRCPPCGRSSTPRVSVADGDQGPTPTFLSPATVEASGAGAAPRDDLCSRSHDQAHRCSQRQIRSRASQPSWRNAARPRSDRRCRCAHGVTLG